MKVGKMRVRRGSLLLLAALSAAILLSGCAKENSGDGGRQTLTVGFDENYPPYGYLSEDGNYIGFDLELAQEVCALRGWKLVKKPLKWEERDEKLDSGEVDCIWSGFTINGREGEYTWSAPYLNNRQVVIVKNGSGIYGLSDLEGKKLGVQTASSALEAIENGETGQSLQSFGAVLKFEDYYSAFETLRKDIVDAVVMDVSVAKYQASYYEGDYRILDETFREEQYGIGFSPGNEELKDLVEEALLELKEKGVYEKLAKKYGLSEYLCL